MGGYFLGQDGHFLLVLRGWGLNDLQMKAFDDLLTPSSYYQSQ